MGDFPESFGEVRKVKIHRHVRNCRGPDDNFQDSQDDWANYKPWRTQNETRPKRCPSSFNFDYGLIIYELVSAGYRVLETYVVWIIEKKKTIKAKKQKIHGIKQKVKKSAWAL